MSRFKNSTALLKPERPPRTPQPAAAAPSRSAPPRPGSPPLRTPDPSTPSNDGVLGRIGFAAALAYVFIRFSIISDTITEVFGFKAYLTYLTAPIALLALLFTGRFVRAIRFKPGIFLCGFFVWLLIATPFSVWRGGSANTVFTAFEADFSMFFMIVGLVTTWQRFRMILFAIAWGGVCDVLLCLMYPGSVDGRFALRFGTLSNPNDLATHLLFILPLCVWAFQASPRFSITKVMMPPAIVGILIIVLRTGSRASLLSLIGLSLFLVFRGSLQFKIIAVLSAAVVFAAAMLLLPDDLKYRYASLFTSSAPAVSTETDVERARDSALGSTAAREALLTNSIGETFRNPLFGVGPGQFAVAEAAVAKDLGRRAAWQVTHNSYTQVSAEAGIPAFLFFVLAFFGAMRLLYLVNRRSRSGRLNYLSGPALWLLISGITLSINIFFSALAYEYYVPSFVALCMVAASIANADGEPRSRKIG
jgi:O-antigen ligase